MDTTRIFWCGPNKIGEEMIARSNDAGVRIVTKACCGEENIDVFMCFSDLTQLEKITNLAVLNNKPLVVGLAELSDEQLSYLQENTATIPIFYSTICSFHAKAFIDKAVRRVMESHEMFYLVERRSPSGKEASRKNFVPSLEAKILQKKILQETGKELCVAGPDCWLTEKASISADWMLFTRKYVNDEGLWDRRVYCDHDGLNKVADNVVEIAKIMATKPVTPDELYDLDTFWDELGCTYYWAED